MSVTSLAPSGPPATGAPATTSTPAEAAAPAAGAADAPVNEAFALLFGLYAQAISPGATGTQAPAATKTVAPAGAGDDADAVESAPAAVSFGGLVAPVVAANPAAPSAPVASPPPDAPAALVRAPVPTPTPSAAAGSQGAGVPADDRPFDDAPVKPLPALLELRTGGDSQSPDKLDALDKRLAGPVDALAPRTLPGNPAAPSPAPAATPHPMLRTVHVPVADPRWADRVGHEVRFLLERGVQAATLRINPEHLGPVEIRIDIVADKANVVFGATQPETRAALAEALPRLRELFAGSGLALGDTGVRQDAPGAFRDPTPRPAGPRPHGVVDDVVEPAAPVVLSVRLGLVDAYA